MEITKGSAAPPLSFLERYPLLAYLHEYRHDRWRFLGAFLLAALKHSVVFALPIYTSFILDFVIPRRDATALALCAAGMLGFVLMNIAVHPLYIRIFSGIRRDVATRLRSRLIERMQQLVFAWHDSSQSGRLHSKIMLDVEKLDQFGLILIEPLAISLTSGIAAATIIAFIEPVFLLIIAFFIPVVLFQHMVLTRRVAERFTRLRREQETLNAEVSEMIVMLPLSRAHATEEEDLRRVGATLGSVRDRGVQTDWTANLLNAQMWGTGQVITISVTVIGAFLAIQGHLTIGRIVMFMSFTGMTIGSLAGILGQMEKFYIAADAMRSIDEVLRYPEIELNDGKPDLAAVEGRVEFDAVSFTYRGVDRPALQNLTVKVAPHQTIALVGGSGAGKTTFVKLLLGLYAPNEGTISIDGGSLQSVNLRSLRRQIGIVTQETFLFNGTILQNITHGLVDVPMERVITAAQQAHAHDFISQLEHGYETEVGDRGLKLSGGQKQRIAIARALLRQPRLLILDEATSALDSQSERLVQEALELLMRDRTTFIIAHRLSTIRNADRILVFDQGQIVEDGHHDELVKRGGVYARLVALQSIA